MYVAFSKRSQIPTKVLLEHAFHVGFVIDDQSTVNHFATLYDLHSIRAHLTAPPVNLLPGRGRLPRGEPERALFGETHSCFPPLSVSLMVTFPGSTFLAGWLGRRTRRPIRG